MIGKTEVCVMTQRGRGDGAALSIVFAPELIRLADCALRPAVSRPLLKQRPPHRRNSLLILDVAAERVLFNVMASPQKCCGAAMYIVFTPELIQLADCALRPPHRRNS